MLDRRPTTVVGVMPSSFQFPFSAIDLRTPRSSSRAIRSLRRLAATALLLAACALPARRAAHTDPTVVLRSE